LDQAEQELSRFDGIMIGRAAYHNPYLLAQVDARFHADDHPIPTRHQVIESFLPYVAAQLENGERLHNLTRHVLGLYHGQAGGRAFRRHLSEHTSKSPKGIAWLQEAAQHCGFEPEPPG
jgi:tRNA-dihydrouridine synthase A